MINSYYDDDQEMFMAALADELDGSRGEAAFEYSVLARLFPSDRPLYWTFEHNAIDENALTAFAKEKGYKVLPGLVDRQSGKLVLFQKL